MLLGSAVLGLIVLFSLVTGAAVQNLLPYGMVVALVAWRHGARNGFLFAGLATLAALAAGAFPTQPEWSGQGVGEGLFTYLKLSAIAMVALYVKEINSRR